MRESCNDAGMVVSPVSRIALVSSSTNRGTPSVRAMIASITSPDSVRPAESRATIASTPARPSRLSVSRVTCGWPPSPGCRSGRLVSRISDARIGDPVQALLDQLQRGRVDPVRVLQHHQDRLPGGEPEQLIHQRRQRPRPLRLRCQIELAVARARHPSRAGRQSGAAASLSASPVAAAPPACPAWRQGDRRRPAQRRGSAAGSPARARCRRDRASTDSECECAARRRGCRAVRG